MRIPIYKLDAFADRLFGGGPTAVCVLDGNLPDATLQAIATENNLAETAFIWPDGAAWRIRWFTPVCEVDLAGHPTLAAAWVVLEKLQPGGKNVLFHGPLGPLPVEKRGGRLRMDFPAVPPRPAEAPKEIAEAVGGEIKEAFEMERIHRVEYRMFVYADEAAVRALTPDYPVLVERKVNILVTAPGETVDFVSRVFCPAVAEPEDPVTGSAHCTSAPYWAQKLGKRALTACQVSPREPKLFCEVAGDRVFIAGTCVPYLEGTITI
ncbi:MAG: PhzF family phenazine biosynthesis protein [Alphaproteobacteria bacterium]|nr:PhzF family phenazine biosynthesis protein [Alphaproteobacteria bacterium]